MADGAEEWSDPERVTEYLSREIPHRLLAEEMLLAALPTRVERLIDLGTGDGRLLAAIRERHPGATAVGFDASEPMLARAAQRFDGDPRVELRRHDLNVPLGDVDPADAVVSGLAIHHLEDEYGQCKLGRSNLAGEGVAPRFSPRSRHRPHSGVVKVGCAPQEHQAEGSTSCTLAGLKSR